MSKTPANTAPELYCFDGVLTRSPELADARLANFKLVPKRMDGRESRLATCEAPELWHTSSNE